MVERRAFIASALGVILAGCSGGDGTSDDGGTPTTTPRDRTETPAPTTGETPSATQTATATRTPTVGGLQKVGDGGEPKGTGTPPDGPKSTADPDPLYEGTMPIPAGERRLVRFAPNDPTVLEYEFRTNLAIDALLMTEAAYEDVGVVAEPDYRPKASVLDTEGDRVRARLRPPEEGYVLVFDNTDLGRVGPGRNAVVDDRVELEATVTLYDQ
jgi:hypothetical protein